MSCGSGPRSPKNCAACPGEDVKRILPHRGPARRPRPPGSEKLSALERYRVRQGNYRIIYGVEEAQEVVEIVKVGHRREVYR